LEKTVLENDSHEMANEMNDLVTKAEMCLRLHRSSRTIERWLRDEILPPPIRVRRSLYWHWSQVVEWLDRYLGGSGPQQSGR